MRTLPSSPVPMDERGTMRRPDSMLHDYLAGELAARGIRGVLLHRQLWCDLWHGQLPRVRQQTSLPVLDIDVADEDADFGRQAGKIQAFMEMLGTTQD